MTYICTFITDLCGYVKRLLRVEGAIFNLKPIAQEIGMPEEETSEIMKIWKNEDDQLKALLQPWGKERSQVEDLDKLRKGLENLKEEGELSPLTTCVPERLLSPKLVSNLLQIFRFHHLGMPRR